MVRGPPRGSVPGNVHCTANALTNPHLCCPRANAQVYPRLRIGESLMPPYNVKFNRDHFTDGSLVHVSPLIERRTNLHLARLRLGVLFSEKGTLCRMSSEDNLRFQIAPRGGGPQASLSLSYNDLLKMRYNYMVIVKEAIPTVLNLSPLFWTPPAPRRGLAM
jgi:hypothetical protein